NDSTIGPPGCDVGGGVVVVLPLPPDPSHEQVPRRPLSSQSCAPMAPLLQAQATLAPGTQWVSPLPLRPPQAASTRKSGIQPRMVTTPVRMATRSPRHYCANRRQSCVRRAGGGSAARVEVVDGAVEAAAILLAIDAVARDQAPELRAMQ